VPADIDDRNAAGDGVPGPAGPLSGVRVLALEQYGAGPWATSHLAELGADVVKIESPAGGGDSGRYVPPFQEGEHSLFFETLNAGKRSVSLDLRHRRGREVLEALVARSDAVFSNLRGDQPARLRLRFADFEPSTRASSASP
jgi:crotonobetainyl-CoA:carnitine CoA-transferase CaiB-like acyl-CoA transferase